MHGKTWIAVVHGSKRWYLHLSDSISTSEKLI